MEINSQARPKCLCCCLFFFVFFRNMHDFLELGIFGACFLFARVSIFSTWERHGVRRHRPSRAVSGHTGARSYEKMSPSDLRPTSWGRFQNSDSDADLPGIRNPQHPSPPPEVLHPKDLCQRCSGKGGIRMGNHNL